MSSIAIAHALPSANADAALQERVVAYLATRNFQSFRRLNVRASRGVVSLTGQLGSYYERQVAIESARRVAGVSRVVDRIVVSDLSERTRVVPRFAQPWPSLAALTALIDEELERDVALVGATVASRETNGQR
jgi:hypothetical protein